VRASGIEAAVPFIFQFPAIKGVGAVIWPRQDHGKSAVCGG
jgi:hypothetical protein